MQRVCLSSLQPILLLQKTISKNQVVAMAEKSPKLVIVSNRNLQKHNGNYKNRKTRRYGNSSKLTLYMPRNSFESLRLDTSEASMLFSAAHTIKYHSKISSMLRRRWPTSQKNWLPSETALSPMWSLIYIPSLYNALTTQSRNFLVIAL